MSNKLLLIPHKNIKVQFGRMNGLDENIFASHALVVTTMMIKT
jgi:hypothetical protein